MKIYMLFVLWVLVLAVNTAYSFLPSKIQGITWVRLCAIAAAGIILVYGAYEPIKSYRSRIYADVRTDGTVGESRNFPWRITKNKTDEGAIIFVINEKHGDVAGISVSTKDSDSKFTIYKAWVGMVIRFDCPEEKIPEFRILISNN